VDLGLVELAELVTRLWLESGLIRVDHHRFAPPYPVL